MRRSSKWLPFARSQAISNGGIKARLEQQKARLEKLYREHSYRVFSYACNRGATACEAEDVVSETFLVCWRRLDDVPADALPWMLGVARKVLSNHWRSRRRREALWQRAVQWLPVDRAVSAESAMIAATPSPVVEGLARLENRDREVLLLVVWDGLSYEQAAEVLGCSPSAFATRLHRARKKLEKQIEGIRTSNIGERAASERGPSG